MTMRFFARNIIGLLLLTFCVQTKDSELAAQQPDDTSIVRTANAPMDTARNSSISILNTGPRGGNYLSSSGTQFDYTIFRIQVINDSIIPMTLHIDFPSNPVKLLPDSAVQIDVFLLPDKFAPDTILDVYNFGAELESYFESGTNQQLASQVSIQAKEQRTIYVVILRKTNIIGKTRAKLFIEGQDEDSPHFPVTSTKNYKISHSTNLIYGISVDPPNYYALIPCGQIRIDK